MTHADDRHTEDRIDGKPFGIPITIRGLNMAVFFVLTVLGGYMFWFFTVENVAQHKAMIEAINEQTYILLADEKEQQEIRQRYRMPKSLSEKLNR